MHREIQGLSESGIHVQQGIQSLWSILPAKRVEQKEGWRTAEFSCDEHHHAVHAPCGKPTPLVKIDNCCFSLLLAAVTKSEQRNDCQHCTCLVPADTQRKPPTITWRMSGHPVPEAVSVNVCGAVAAYKK